MTFERIRTFAYRYQVLLALLIVVAILWFHFTFKPYEKENIAHFVDFNSSELNGRILHIENSGGITYLQLKGHTKEYQFRARYTEHEPNIWIGNVTASNDSILKRINSDTLYVYKIDRVYKFTFAKYDSQMQAWH